MTVDIFIIRNGMFGLNFELKLLFTLVGLFLCWYDWRHHKRGDYLVVFLVGTIIWGTVEVMVQLIGTRVFSEVQLLGITLPLWAVGLIRGTSEGAFISVSGLFIADRILDAKNQVKAWWGLGSIATLVVVLTLLQRVPAKLVGGDVISRRDICTGGALVFLVVMACIVTLWYVKSDTACRKRGLYFFGVMSGVALLWTAAEVSANTRWVEIGSNFARAPLMVEWLALSYDVFIEIGLWYVGFFGIAVILGLIPGLESKNSVRFKRGNKP